MCGIFAHWSIEHVPAKNLLKFFANLHPRGPDESSLTRIDYSLLFGFQRLAIHGLDASSGQPMADGHGKNMLIANAEIFNFEKLKATLACSDNNSDCEAIHAAFDISGGCPANAIAHLDGEFAFVMARDDEVILSRDPLGVRGMFFAHEEDHTGRVIRWAAASELKGLVGITNWTKVIPFPPGRYLSLSRSKPIFADDVNAFKHYFAKIPIWELSDQQPLTVAEVPYETAIVHVRELFIEAVRKRLSSDRGVGVFCSGGLDSVSVLAAVRHIRGPDAPINTYTVGMPGSTDLHFGRLAAEYFNTQHFEALLSEHQFLDAVRDTARICETWDTTTIRASVGNMLVSKHVASVGKDVVMLCGDVSDELFGGYLGFQGAPSEHEFHKVNMKMLRELYAFDLLRADRTISSFGLEGRVPFADFALLEYVASLPVSYKTWGALAPEAPMEKMLLRDAMRPFLPDFIANRRKEAFSDGVSSKTRSWYQILKDNIMTMASPVELSVMAEIDKQFDGMVPAMNNSVPVDAEGKFYRALYYMNYGSCNEHLIPSYWRQPFCQELDPSARKLKSYVGDTI